MMVDIIFMFVGGIALLLGAKTGSMILILVGLLAMGLSYGANPTICSTLIQKYYGPLTTTHIISANTAKIKIATNEES